MTNYLSALSKFGYGALFTVLWPALLAWLALRLDAMGLPSWPVPLPAIVGAPLFALGLALMAAGVWALWRHGGGLPMNAFPPRQFVTRSVYALVPHPIYVGFVLACAAASVVTGCAAGFQTS